MIEKFLHFLFGHNYYSEDVDCGVNGMMLINKCSCGNMQTVYAKYNWRIPLDKKLKERLQKLLESTL